ncbi:MAG: hypothetical protein J6X47_07965 [Clostridia bacterium]|nr:hypothetical protein [Clostridia bacterium]
MKALAKILSLLIAAIMILSFAACANGISEDTQKETEPVAQTGEGSEAEVTTSNGLDPQGYKLDDLDPNLDFENETVSILFWSDSERPEFEITEEENNGSLINSAIYNRNVRTEERLKVTLEWTGKDGDNTDRAAFTQYVETTFAGGTYFDIIATYSRTSAMLIVRGLLKNLKAIDNSHLNFSQPWWPKRLVDTVEINGKIYSVSGDISTNVLHFMYCVYYNIELLESLNLEDPIPLVDSKHWTIDKLIELSSNVHQDLNQDGKKDNLDAFGFVSVNYGLDAFYTGSGLRLVEQDPEKTLIISPDYVSQKAVDLEDKLGAWLATESCFVGSDYAFSFADGNTLFMQNRVYAADGYKANAEHNLNGVAWAYGVLPTPLYDLDQPEYITVVGNPFTLWGIETNPVDDSGFERATAVIECMASYGYRLTTPALFETNMKYRYTTESKGDSVRMFDIIHNTIDFDLGRIFSNDLDYMSETPSKAAAVNAQWGAQMLKVKSTLDSKLKKVVKNILDKAE